MADTDDARFKALATGVQKLGSWGNNSARPHANFQTTNPALAAGATWTVTHNLMDTNPSVVTTKAGSSVVVDLAWTPTGPNTMTAVVNSAQAVGTLVVTATGRRPATPYGVKTLGVSPSLGGWHSGLSLYGGATVPRMTAAGTWRGRPIDAVVSYVDYSSWSNMAGSGWAADMFTGMPGYVKVIVGVGLLVDGSTDTFSDVAAGKHDTEFTQLANSFAAACPNAIIRLAWEMNANSKWYAWQPTKAQAADFQSAYKRVVGIFRKASSKFKIDFTITANNPVLGDTARNGVFDLLYPGDSYVDIVGIDHYDFNAIKSPDHNSFLKSCRPTQGPGLDDVAEFCRAHKKPMSIPEWGVVMPVNNGQGDNAFFITAMRAWMEAHADILAYEAYFNDNGASINSLIWSDTSDKVTMTASAAAYKSLWKA